MYNEISLSKDEIYLLENYSKAITHMHYQYQTKRFGLFLGTGVSKPLGLPDWNELIRKIARHRKVRAVRLLGKKGKKANQTSTTQMLYEHFKVKNFKPNEGEFYCSPDEEIRIKSKWRTIIHHCLYEDAKEKGNLTDLHPYLKEYLEIIKKTYLTVNYNFDDIIERMLLEDRIKSEEEKSRGYETVWHPRMNFKTDTANIYHPNGFLPKTLIEGPSDELIFSEYEFADQLIHSMEGHLSTLLHHLSKYTCLLIGLSLEDSTLRHLLRQNAKLNPGNFHYFVAFVDDEDEISQKKKDTIFNANYSVYNLYTLFLTNNQIATLAKILKCSKDDFQEKTDELAITNKYIYYITGLISSGKTTNISYLRNFATFDEWLEERIPELSLNHKTLNTEEKENVDNWIAVQFYLKDRNLYNSKQGIYIIDRSPLDPISFTDYAEMGSKAKNLLKTIIRGKSNRKVMDGHVIYLKCDLDRIRKRIPITHKGPRTKNDLKEMQNKLDKLYNGNGVTIIDTTSLTQHQVVTCVCEIIYKHKYTKKNIHDDLIKIKEGKHDVLRR